MFSLFLMVKIKLKSYNSFRCFCFSPNALRIFGWSWWSSAKNMTCACSQRQYNIKKERQDATVHCEENGNYEKLQCDNGLCWCAEPESGKPTQRAYPEAAMEFLPCYERKNAGLQYFRRCESKKVTRVKLLEKMKYHGHKSFHIDDVRCDYDGSYGHYQVGRNIARCTWKDGKQIEDFKTDDISQIAKMNCNCARDSLIFADTNYEFRLICDSLGNYKPLQHSNGYQFCVDRDGFATTELVSIENELQCQ